MHNYYLLSCIRYKLKILEHTLILVAFLHNNYLVAFLHNNYPEELKSQPMAQAGGANTATTKYTPGACCLKKG